MKKFKLKNESEVNKIKTISALLICLRLISQQVHTRIRKMIEMV